MCEIFGVSSKTRVDINEYLKVFFSHSNKHPWKVRNQYGQEYVKKGLVLAKELQDKELCGAS